MSAKALGLWFPPRLLTRVDEVSQCDASRSRHIILVKLRFQSAIHMGDVVPQEVYRDPRIGLTAIYEGLREVDHSGLDRTRVSPFP
jgi:hypothetical protein